MIKSVYLKVYYNDHLDIMCFINRQLESGCKAAWLEPVDREPLRLQ